jgi:hypothetical protein
LRPSKNKKGKFSLGHMGGAKTFENLHRDKIRRDVYTYYLPHPQKIQIIP